MPAPTPSDRRLQRAGRRLGAALCATLLATAAVAASVPEPVVLVLKLVSETHARPVTGVVISPSGDVLVPARFVSRGDEIVVLDGGTDIGRHGLATRTAARSPDLGLALLAVDGLRRPAIALAGDDPGAEPLRLVAFPPANELASGMPPIDRRVEQVLRGDVAAIDPATRLPNLDGVLLNTCAQLAGLVLAEGEASLEGDRSPRVILAPQLGQALAELGAQPVVRPCDQAPPERTHSVLAAESGDAPSRARVQILDAGNLSPAAPDTESREPQRPPDHAPLAAEAIRADAANFPETDHPPARPTQTPPATALPASQAIGPWQWALALSGLAGLVGWLLGRNRPAAARPPRSGNGGPDEKVARPAIRAAGPAAKETEIELRYTLADGREGHWKTSLPADAPGVLIGRGPADLVVNDPSVGHLHARLALSGAALTLTDLGSRRGTWVAGVACLEGECFYLDEGGHFRLGQAHFTVRLPGHGREVPAA